MKLNPLAAEEFGLFVRPSLRRIYAVALLVPAGIFFAVLPTRVFAAGFVAGNSPDLFMTSGTAEIIIVFTAAVLSLHLVSGWSSPAPVWLTHIRFRSYILGKIMTATVMSLTFSLLPLPVLVLSARFEPLPAESAFLFSLMLFPLLLFYFQLMETLELCIDRYPVIRRIIIWSILLFHLLLSTKVMPVFNPFVILDSLSAGVPVSFFILFLPAVFIIVANIILTVSIGYRCGRE